MRRFFLLSRKDQFFALILGFLAVQENVAVLLDSNGSVVVKCKYDACGKCVVDASTTNTTKYDIIHGEFR